MGKWTPNVGTACVQNAGATACKRLEAVDRSAARACPAKHGGRRCAPGGAPVLRTGQRMGARRLAHGRRQRWRRSSAVDGPVARGMPWVHRFFPTPPSEFLVLIITEVRPYQGENGNKKTKREEGNEQCEPPPERQGNHGKKGFEAWGPRGMPLRKSERNTQIMHDSVHPHFPLPPVACTCAFSCCSIPDGHAIAASYTLGEPSQS
jgi:hypothetical protein